MKFALLDTDTISYFFKGYDVVVEKVDSYLQQHGSVSISLITYYEVMNGLLYKDAQQQLKKFEQFVEFNHVLPLDQAIAFTAAQTYANLRKTGQIIGHNDVLIGATALEQDMIVVTNNAKHFSRIPGISIRQLGNCITCWLF